MITSLSKGFFQRAYVTTDLDRAISDVSKVYGLHDFLQMRDIPFSSDASLQIALAYAGDNMIELIQPVGNAPLYNCMLPDSGYALHFHHYGHRLDSQADWEAMTAEVARQGLAVSVQGVANGVLHFLYADSRPQLGHFLEFIYCTPEGAGYFDQVPRN